MIIESLSGVKHEEKGLTPDSPVKFHRKLYREDSFVRMHYHSSYEINICEKLHGTINVEGRTFDLNRIKVIFLTPGTLHSYRIKSGLGNIKVWHVGLQLFPFINFDEVNRHFQNNSYQISGSGDVAMETEELLSEIFSSENLTRSAGVLKLLSMFQVPQQIHNVSRKNSFLYKIINWSEASFSENITLDDAASAVHLSRYHFCRKFKDHTGSSYMEYLNNLRLESSLLLLEKGISVSESADMSGFSDVSYFIKKFRLLYNKTPLEYQKSI